MRHAPRDHHPPCPEVAKATAAALRAAVISAIAENTSVSNFRQLSFSPKAKISYSGEPAATRGRKRSRSLEARSIAAEGLVGGPLREDGGGEGRRSVASGRASLGRSADSRGSSTNLLRSGSTGSAGGQYPRRILSGRSSSFLPGAARSISALPPQDRSRCSDLPKVRWLVR